MSSEAVLTVRLVRSFEHRNFKPVVFRGVDLNQTVEEFIAHVRKVVSSKDGLPPPFKKFGYEIFAGQTLSWHHISNFLHNENKDLTVVQLKILSPGLVVMHSHDTLLL
ncbi:UPF0538 protein C2orf76 homolog isoform X2 [Paramormyrops kingsleyae]|uniref:UPF0538 protein C2orf76 homolog isoform X2 n=1 Tax=Paramormyrops kingsleyae TaxID=1676925 RepID=UPI003B97AF92